MGIPRYAWGIDIGNRALKAIKLVRGDTGLRVDDFDVIEHESVLSQAGDNRESLIQSALANFVQRHPGSGGAVAIGVSGQSSFARFIKLPPVEPKKIPEIVRFEAIQQIPFPLDDVEWSYQLFQQPDSPDVEVGIFAMRKELVNHQIKFYTDVDLNVQVVQMNPLAVYNAMYHDERIQGTTMIIDLGAENTDLIIAEGETIWLRSIQIGGNNFTEAIARASKLNFVKAEELKRGVRTSKYARQLLNTMRPVFADLVSEVQRSIGFYASVHRDSRINRIIALGNTFRLPGLQKYLQQNLQIEVNVIDSLAAGVPADTKQATLFNENILSTISAYGLAIQAMGEGKINSSLLPEKIRREKLWKEKTKWFATAAAMVVLSTGVVGGSYYVDKLRYDQAEETRQKIASVQQAAEQNDAKWTEIEASGSGDRQRITNVKSLENYRTTWSDLLTDIHDSLPKPQWDTTVNDPAEIQKIPRGDRKLIQIDSIVSEYDPNIAAKVALGENFKTVASANGVTISGIAGGGGASGFGGGGGGGGARSGGSPTFSGGGSMSFGRGGPGGYGGGGEGAPAGPAERGYIVTVRCSTPNSKAPELVANTLVQNLAKLNKDFKDPKKARSYYIGKAAIASVSRLGDNDQWKMRRRSAQQAAMQKANQPAPGVGGGAGMALGTRAMGGGIARPGMGGANAGPQPGDKEAFADALGEDMTGDSEVTVVFAVVLDPPPKTDTPPPAQ